MDMPPAETACQEWADVPGTHVATLAPEVGTNQEISPTSVEPLLCWKTSGFISSCSPIFARGLIKVL